VFFVPIFCFGQVNESFLDGNFINNPIWSGTTSNFKVNSSLQLQSNAAGASTSYLFTPSEAIENASWECWVKIDYSTSGSNYACIYLISDREDVSSGCNGYYVQVGGKDHEVSLFVQEGTKKTKIIDGTDGRTSGKIVLWIKVTRDADGNFALYSKVLSMLIPETDYVLEGTTQNKVITSSSYFGLMFVNPASAKLDYYFDDIVVIGTKAQDKEAPVWSGLNIEQPNKLKLSFSEAMDFSSAAFSVNQNLGNPTSQSISNDKMSVVLSFGSDFENGKSYKLTTSELKDLAGNALMKTDSIIGIIEAKGVGDLILNEIMFENPANSLEYIEIYNKSGKLLDVSNMIFTTRKTDGTLNTGVKIPSNTLMSAHSYLVVCAKADSVRNYHRTLSGSTILTTSTWSALNNTGATLVFTNAAKDTIYDELTYNTNWHSSWVKDAKGISLERISPDLPTQSQASWHSCLSSSTNYGTPGFENSFYEDQEAPVWTGLSIEQPNKLKLSFSEAMDFSRATFKVDPEIGSTASQTVSDDKKSIELVFPSYFERGVIYTLQTSGLVDLAGNTIQQNDSTFGIIEPISAGDLIFNEILFDNPENSTEYLEIYNNSEKLLNVSDLIFTTRKKDGSLNNGNKIPAKTWMLPHAYLALCTDADSVRNYYQGPEESKIISTKWSSINNESATLVLTNSAKDTIYDELTYNVKWHHTLIKNPKGVSLERINPNLPTQNANSWHSAASEVKYGTPGYANSQFRDLTTPGTTEKIVWTEPEAFSPDNDGVNDLCLIHYKTDIDGYVANVIVFNKAGVKICRLASNILLASNGFLIWDGRTDKGKLANVGIYIVYFELFNPEHGIRKQIKIPIVVSSR